MDSDKNNKVKCPYCKGTGRETSPTYTGTGRTFLLCFACVDGYLPTCTTCKGSYIKSAPFLTISRRHYMPICDSCYNKLDDEQKRFMRIGIEANI